MPDSAFQELKGTTAARMVPIFASRQDRVVVGNRYTASFLSYDAEGRPLHRWGHNFAERFRSDAELDSIVETLGPYGGTFERNGRTVQLPTKAQRRKMLNSAPQ